MSIFIAVVYGKISNLIKIYLFLLPRYVENGRKCMLSFGRRVQNGHEKARGRGYNCWSIRQKSHDQDWVHEDGANLQSGKLGFFSFNVKCIILYLCSSVVRAFAHGAMGRRIDPSWGGLIELFLVPASAPRLV